MHALTGTKFGMFLLQTIENQNPEFDNIWTRNGRYISIYQVFGFIWFGLVWFGLVQVLMFWSDKYGPINNLTEFEDNRLRNV